MIEINTTYSDDMASSLSETQTIINGKKEQNKKPDLQKAKQKAEQILKDNLVTAPPILAKELAESEGLKVIFFSQRKEMPDISGIIDAKNKKLYVNVDEPPLCQNFTIAHELGHYVLGHTDSEEYKTLFRLSTSEKKENILEKEADFFAANLLVPDNIFKEKIKDYPFATDKQLGLIFGVSRYEITRKRLEIQNE